MTGRLMAISGMISGMLALVLAGCGGESEPQGAAPAPQSGNVAQGAEIFKLQCAACHGPTGHGDGVGAAALPIKPRNLTTEAYKFVDIAGAGSEHAALVNYIKEGKIESGMPPFAHLPAADVNALAAFVMSIRPKPNFVEEPPAEEAAPTPEEGPDAGGAGGHESNDPGG